MRIGQIVKAKLDIPDAETIRYEVHKDSSSRTGSVVKPKIVLPVKDSNANAPTVASTPAIIAATGGAGAAATLSNTKETVITQPATMVA